MAMLRPRLLLASLFAIAAVGTVHAQLVATDEFQANTYTLENQNSDAHLKITCSAADGDFVVVWTSFLQDGFEGGVFGQRFASSGLKAGTEFQVSTYTLDDEREPDLCCQPDGDFVVLWHSRHDGSDRGIFGQRFTSSAARVGAEFQVNTFTPDDQEDASVCCDGSGGFAAAWESEGQDEDEAGIYAKRFDSNGNAIGGELQINSFTEGDQEDPALCCARDGAFVAVWNRNDPEDIAGQRVASSGALVGAEFLVNTYTPEAQDEAAICCDGAGNFVVAWSSYSQDGDELGVFGQRFASDGDRLGAEFQANTFTIDAQTGAAACCDSIGSFVVAWQSYAQDGYDNGIFAQRFANGGGRLGVEFQVTQFTEYDQIRPALACGDRDFVVVWQSFGQDGDRAGIFGRLFRIPLAPSPAPMLGLAGLALAVLSLAAFGIARLMRPRSPRLEP